MTIHVMGSREGERNDEAFADRSVDCNMPGADTAEVVYHPDCTPVPFKREWFCRLCGLTSEDPVGEN